MNILDRLFNAPMTEPLKRDVGLLTPLPQGRNAIPPMGAPHPAMEEMPGSSWARLPDKVGLITWHWERWLAPGYFHLLVARSGLGKSALLLRLAGCYLCGWSWPDGTPFTQEPGAVLWCEAEGAQALNLDRATRWQLPLDRLLTPLNDPLADVSLDNPQHLKAILRMALRPEVKLIVLDSLSGARAGQDENDSRVLQATKKLAVIARDTGKPIIASHHLRKRSPLDGSEEVNLERIRGSSALVQVARVVWALDTPDREAPHDLRLRVLKNNLTRFPSPLGMTIDEGGCVGFGEAPEAAEAARRLNQTERAAEFLRQLLQMPVAATEVFRQAKEMGFSSATLKRAKEIIGADSYREGERWFWFMPDDA